MTDYERSIEKFYSLKKKYESKERKRKKKDPSIEKKCISCKKNGGTNFIVKNDILKATCNCKKKCKLNIEIQIEKYTTVSEILIKLRNDLENVKEQIILLKLDNLFNIKKSDDVTPLFKPLKKKYNKIYKKILNLENYLKQNKENNEMFDLMIEHIMKIKSTLKEYHKQSNVQLLTDAINIYIEELTPLRDSIQEKYTVYSEKKDVFRFKKQTENMEILLNKGKVISNIT